jgi:pyridoxal phosphate enzyme (YggS family)
VAEVRERIARAAARSGRKPGDVLLVAVTKTIPAERIDEAIAAGITDLGENRVQEALEKISQIRGQATWHLVGHLQTNKVSKALELFDWIHSLDSLHLAEAVGKRARELGKVVPVLVEVNTSGEETKFGLSPERAAEEVARIGNVTGIAVKGLMTVGTFGPVEEARACFQSLRRLRDEIAGRAYPGVTMEHLSMGMTNDFEAAIEEGATMVRIGTAIFGARS